MSGLAKIFVNANAGAIIMLHRPFGIGIDSRDFISIVLCILRCLLAEILRRIVMEMTRVPAIGLVPTNEEDDDEIGVHPYAAVTATYFLEASRHGLHLDKRICGAEARDAITCRSIMACLRNNLTRHDSHPDHPTGEVGRNVWRELHRDGRRDRLTERVSYHDTLSFLCHLHIHVYCTPLPELTLSFLPRIMSAGE